MKQPLFYHIRQPRQKASIVLLFSLFYFAFRTAQEPLTVYLIGDSTMADKKLEVAPETGWGMVLQHYFDPAKVLISNHAVNGRSSGSFIREGRWENVLSTLRKGDYVFIQFGHNDSKSEDTSRYAPAFTTYTVNLTKFVNEARGKGAVPVLLTPVMRRRFDKTGKFFDTHGDYPDAVRRLAAKLDVPLIDMHQKSRTILEQAGEQQSKDFFLHLKPGQYAGYPKGVIDDTHFSGYGARMMAAAAAKGIQENNLPLAAHFKRFGSTDKFVFELPEIKGPVFRKDTFDIRKYGAVPDGKTMNSAAIQKAVDHASEAGGGVVLIPEGLWLTGPVILKSNVNLHLAVSSVLQFSDNYQHYPLVRTSWEGREAIRCQAPVSAQGAVNIAITGQGIMDGAGQAWRPVKKEKLTESQWKKLTRSGGVTDKNQQIWWPSAEALEGSLIPDAGNISAGYTEATAARFKEYLRPNMIRFIQCENILLEGVTFQNSPAWNIHLLLSRHITLRKVNVRNPWFAQNGDGVDIESCSYAMIDASTFDVGDDGICIKSGRDEEGRKRGIPSENIIVRNSTVFHGHGGFVIGSEMSGGVRNIYVTQCNFLGTDVGLRFKTARGRGGVVENIFISDINMTGIPGEALLFDMYYQAKDPVPADGSASEAPEVKAIPVNEGTPQFRHFHIRNVTVKGAGTGILIRGLPEMSIKNITIENAVIQANKGLECTEGEAVLLKNISLITRDSTVMKIRNSQAVTMDTITYGENAGTLLNVSGVKTRGIRLLNTQKPVNGKLIVTGGQVPENAVQIQ